jgi:acyl carrier protein
MAAALGITAGCWRQGGAPLSPNAPRGNTAGTSSSKTGTSVTRGQADAFAAALERAVNTEDVVRFREEFDTGAFRSLVFSGFDGNNQEARSLRASFEKTLENMPSQVFDQILQQVHGGGSYEYLRTIERDDGFRPVFRLRTPEGAINYHEYRLIRRPRGARFSDVFIYASGERLSETMQRLLLTALPPDKQTILASLSGSAQASLRRALPLQDISLAFKRGEHQHVLAMYESLSPELRAEKTIQIFRVMSAQKVDEAAYSAAMDDYRAAFPNDPSIYLMSLDSHLLARRFKEYHDTLDRLNEQVGGDPYLEAMRANVLIMEGKFDQAKTIAQSMLAADPLSIDAHWLLVSLSLAQKSFEATRSLLTTLRDEIGVPLGDLTQVPEYAEFVASPEFAKWRASNQVQPVTAKQSTIDKVRKIVSEQMGVKIESLSSATSLVELGADELDYVELVMELEDVFKISIPDSQAERLADGNLQKGLKKVTIQAMAALVDELTAQPSRIRN